jgi:FAD/FMN-containing dehydrogenase
MGVKCRTIRAALDALARAPATALPAWAAEHLARCRSCARQVATARLAHGLVAQTAGEPQVPAGFADRILAAIARGSRAAARRDARRDEGPAEFWAPARRLLPAFAAAAACCLILLQVMAWTEPLGYLSGEELTPAEQFVLGVTPPDPDAVLAVVMAGDRQ